MPDSNARLPRRSRCGSRHQGPEQRCFLAPFTMRPPATLSYGPFWPFRVAIDIGAGVGVRTPLRREPVPFHRVRRCLLDPVRLCSPDGWWVNVTVDRGEGWVPGADRGRAAGTGPTGRSGRIGEPPGEEARTPGAAAGSRPCRIFGLRRLRRSMRHQGPERRQTWPASGSATAETAPSRLPQPTKLPPWVPTRRRQLFGRGPCGAAPDSIDRS